MPASFRFLRKNLRHHTDSFHSSIHEPFISHMPFLPQTLFLKPIRKPCSRLQILGQLLGNQSISLPCCATSSCILYTYMTPVF
jgi:hypothetical protein